MQQALTYRTNRDLFSNYYLDEHLPETEEWGEVSDEELEAAYDDIMDLWEREKSTAPKRNESQLEEKFIRPMFRKLGIPFEVEESTSRTQRRPDYGFFESEGAARDAFERREEDGNFYKNAVAVADAKRWGRPLDTRGSGEHERDFENPSYQIHVYLQETPARWAVLTDGKKWRLYYGATSHRLDSYYEVDLPTILESGDLEDFKYFYLFFRHEAFLKDASGDCFLDDVYGESNVFAQELGEDLQDNIYEAIKVLSEGFLQYPENDLDEDDLDLIHDSSLIYLYRLIFVLYAEAEGRDLLNTDNEIYEEQYSLNNLKQEVVEELDSGNPAYRDWQNNLWDRLDELFTLIDQGSKSRGIPEDDLYIPAYNGGLFRTDPDSDDSPEANFLAKYKAGDAYLAKVIDLLTRSENTDIGGKIFVDYSSLDVRHLGSIYEGLLEYQLNVANEPLALEDGEYVIPGEDDDIAVEEGEVYLTTDSGERKVTGSYYTPEYVVEYIVENTLGPLVEDIRMDLAGQSAYDEGGFAAEFADRVFELKILDPAMGSGHFLTSAVDYLAREIIDAQEKQAAQQGIETVDEDHDINWARRQVAQRCIYGVDLNPLAVELSKVSLWLRTLAAEQPLAFLDHHLKAGNSLVGSDIETVLDNGESGVEGGQLTLQESFDRTRRQALEHITDQFEDLLSIDNETLDDVKEMEAVYEEVRDDSLYQHLIAMANVHTAEQFELSVPEDAYKRMATALRDGSWNNVEQQDWYSSAQQVADDERFFHWELEFPIAFYEQDGARKENGGFDVVIGNPPWLNAWRMTDKMPEKRDAIKQVFESSDLLEGHWDLYIPFIIQSLNLCRNGGRHSFIVPNLALTEKYAKNLRRSILTDHKLESLLDFGERNVFENVERQSIIYVAESNDESTGPHEIRVCTGTDPFDYETLTNTDPEVWLNAYNHQIRLDEDYVEKYVPIIDKIERNSNLLGQYLYVNVGATVASSESGGFVKDDVVYEEPVGDAKRFIQGTNVSRWYLNWADEWLDYRPEEMSGPRHPEMFEAEKLLVRKRTDKGGWIACVYDDEGMYCDDTILVCCDYDVLEGTGATLDFEGFERLEENLNLTYAVALLNSTLMTWLFKNKFETGGLQGTYSDVWPQSVRSFPIPKTESRDYPLNEWVNKALNVLPEQLTDKVQKTEEPQELLSIVSKGVIEAVEEQNQLNLNILDYLGIPSDELPDSMASDTLGNRQIPISGVADTPLNKTTKDFDGLRIEDVSFEDDGERLVMSVDVSYKPDEDDKRETDTWNRLVEEEFETYDAMAFVGLSDVEETLIRNFVPTVVKEAGGFAGFRKKATKTNSPLDRLKDLTLPEIEAVRTGMEQYTEVKIRADELDEKIENAELLIDEIVYDLYDLTDEETEIVESAVQDD